MESNVLSQILMGLLIISVIILFVLIISLIVIKLKRKEDKDLEEEQVHNNEVNSKTKTLIAKTYSTEDIKKFLEFDEIKDNMIVQKDVKKLVMVIQCQGINYDLMSSIEKVSVEQGFIQFLNTLTRPIQLYIQTRKVNLEDSINNYQKRLKNIESSFNKIRFQYDQAQRNTSLSPESFKKIRMEYIRQKNLLEYTKDIIANTEKMSLNKNILTKKYYVAISYYPDNSEELLKKEEILDMAFSELYTNAQAIIRTLGACSMNGKVLDSVELADLLYVAYNRDSSEIYGIDKAIKAGYDSLYTTAPDVIEKKIAEIDRAIKDRAVELANDEIGKATLNNQRKKELEEKEKNIDELIKEMAKSMILENEEYITSEIAEEAIENIEKKKTRKSKKGA